MTEYERQKQEYIDNAIRYLYSHPTGKGEVKRFLKTHNMTSYTLQLRCLQLNINRYGNAQHRWKADELQILKRNKDKSASFIRKELRKKGYCRSEQGISHQLGYRKWLSEVKEDKFYTIESLSRLMGINNTSISSWIKRGLLRVIKPQSHQRNGQYYKIYRRDLRVFIIENMNLVDIAKVDKLWFVDLLTNIRGDN